MSGAALCGDESFPGAYARLDHPDIWNFIYDTIHGKGNSNGLKIVQFREIIIPFYFFSSQILQISVFLHKVKSETRATKYVSRVTLYCVNTVFKS